MMSFRPGCLRLLAVCVFCSSPLFPQAGPPPAQAPKPQQNNPFESVPTAPAQPAPPPLRPEPAKPATPGAAPETAVQPIDDTIEAIEFRGVRRVPQDTLRALIFSRVGDKYDPETVHRDEMALWNTGRFDDF